MTCQDTLRTVKKDGGRFGYQDVSHSLEAGQSYEKHRRENELTTFQDKMQVDYIWLACGILGLSVFAVNFFSEDVFG